VKKLRWFAGEYRARDGYHSFIIKPGRTSNWTLIHSQWHGLTVVKVTAYPCLTPVEAKAKAQELAEVHDEEG
jgi:hypothetical protein